MNAVLVLARFFDFAEIASLSYVQLMPNPPSRWQKFWARVDDDFNDVRPWSLGLFCILTSAPLGLAFAFDASTAVIETARFSAIGSVFLLMGYYIYRQIRNFVRWLRDE